MNLYQGIILFLFVAIIVVGVFCFVGWYFDRKRTQYFNSLHEEIDLQAYKDQPYFDISLLQKKSQKDTQIQQPDHIKQFNINLHKLNLDTQDGRSNRALTNKSDSSSRPMLAPLRKNFDSSSQMKEFSSRPNKTITHTFVSKLIRYSAQGIELINYDVKSVCCNRVFTQLEWQEKVSQTGMVNRYFYESESTNLANLLELFKLELGDYVCVKFLVTLEIKNCQLSKEYFLKDVKIVESVDRISEDEFRIDQAQLLALAK